LTDITRYFTEMTSMLFTCIKPLVCCTAVLLSVFVLNLNILCWLVVAIAQHFSENRKWHAKVLLYDLIGNLFLNPFFHLQKKNALSSKARCHMHAIASFLKARMPIFLGALAI
jgi:uncharacterized membrane protein YGL010W